MYDEQIQALLGSARVRAALRSIADSDEETLRDQVELTGIAAPPFGEAPRAREFLRRVKALGPDEAAIDEVGNVVARRRGRGTGEVLAVTAHLDTVFPSGTDVTVRRRGRVLSAPGIADDGRGLATLLALARALDRADLRTDADLLFVATVGEEGRGDLRGVKHLFREGGPRIDAFISIDGSEPGRIVHRALGSVRYRIAFRGPGGHSWASFGTVNPAHVLGRAIVALIELGDRLREEFPRTSYNVGRVGGGTSINSIPAVSWMEVDLRSESEAMLDRMDARFRAAVDQVVGEANLRRGGGGPLRLDIEEVGRRPGGAIHGNEPLVLRATAASRALGIEPSPGCGSTDANIPISLGVPAVTIGGGGVSGGTHTLEEWFENVDGARGVQRALLLLLAHAGPRGSGPTQRRPGSPPRYGQAGRSTHTGGLRQSPTKEEAGMAIRTATATWRGGLPGGSGHVRSESGALDTDYTFSARFENGSGSNPEELIASAHAGCFAMALSGNLGRAGHSPEQVRVEGRVKLEKQEAGHAITEIRLVCEARVPGIDDAAFQEQVEAARTGCPISKALAAVPIHVEARLVD